MDRVDRISMIHQYLTGQLTPDQVHEFEQWRSANSDNEELFAETSRVWDLSKEYVMPSFDTKAALSKMPFAPEEDLHIAPEPVQSRPTFRMWLPRIAATGAIAVMAWFAYDMMGANMISASGAESSYVTLSDGTEVFLTESATIEYPENFTGNTRTVILDGEAFFEVEPGDKKFIIETDFASVTVLGTKFGVNENDDNGSVDVDVTEGRVRVQPNGSDAFVDLQAGEEATFDSRTMELKPNRRANLNDVAWHTGKLVFRDTPFSQVVKDLEKAFEVTIKITSEELLTCGFTSNYSNTSIDKIFEDMTTLWGISVMSVEEGVYSVGGGACR